MRTIDIPLPSGISSDSIEAAFDGVVQECGLNVALKSTLSRYKGSIHWHLAKPGERGTLELTYWPKEERAWFSVQSRRDAEWISSKIEALLVLLG